TSSVPVLLFLNGTRYAWPSGPGSRPSWAQVMSAPRNDAGSACPSCGVCLMTVVAMRASRSGSMCRGSAPAISGFCRSMSVASVFCRCATALLIFAIVGVLPGRCEPVDGRGGRVLVGEVGVVGAQPFGVHGAAFVPGAGDDPPAFRVHAVSRRPELVA